jgi:hypothetical protein
MSADSGKELFRLGFLTAIEVPERGYVGGLLVTNQFGRPLEFQCTAPLKPNRTQEILYGPTLVPYVLGDLIGRTLIEKVGVKPHIVLTELHELLGLRDLVEIPVASVHDMPTNGSPVAVAEASTATEAADTDASDGRDELRTMEPVVVDQPLPADAAELGGAAGTDPSTSILEASISEPALALDGGTSDGGSPGSVLEPTRLDETAERTRRPKRTKTSAEDCSPIQLGRQMLHFHKAHVGDRSIASRGAEVVPNNADLREPFERVREALGETARLGGAR